MVIGVRFNEGGSVLESRIEICTHGEYARSIQSVIVRSACLPTPKLTVVVPEFSIRFDNKPFQYKPK